MIFEDGLQARDFVHVGDIVRSVLLALEPGAADGLPVNVGTGCATSVLDVATTLAHALGKPAEPETRNEYRAGDIRHCFADITRARELLGFDPAVSFAEGMAELTGWLAEQDSRDGVLAAAAQLARRGLIR